MIGVEEYEAAVAEITDELHKTEKHLAKLHAALGRARDRMDADLGIVRPADGTPKPPHP